MADPLEDVRADARALREALLQLPDLIADFRKITGISAAKLGYSAVGYPSIVLKIKRGSNVRTDTLVKLLDYMEKFDAKSA
jgi:hypothetical protein